MDELNLGTLQSGEFFGEKTPFLRHVVLKTRIFTKPGSGQT
jgi:hypothetical protein